jgi:hypothetical protein
MDVEILYYYASKNKQVTGKRNWNKYFSSYSAPQFFKM